MNRLLHTCHRHSTRNALLLLAGLLAVVLASPASAEIGTDDIVPAATLLLPYFEVDLTNPQGVNTLFSISNANQGPAIVNITLWTDWSVPTLTFNAYLTGFDVMDIDLRSLFVGGSLPATSHVDTSVSNIGQFSLGTNATTGVGPSSVSCDAILPLPPLPTALIDHIDSAHTGQASAIFAGSCSGSNLGDTVARGYITVDNVSTCTLQFPDEVGYFVDGGTGVANNANALLGSYRIVEEATGLSHGGAAVHIEAASNDPRTNLGSHTFYARYTGGADNREPLASAVAAPYAAGVTELIYWRDSHAPQGPVSCGTTPSWFPLATNQIVLFDREENPEIPQASPFSPPINPTLTPFSSEAGRVKVGSVELPALFVSGWLYLDLGTSTGSSLDPFAQGWIGVVDRDPGGLFLTSQPAWQIFNTSENQATILPCAADFPSPLCGTLDGLFADGFESGGVVAWSTSVP